MTVENLEARFDEGKNVLDYFDLSSMRILCPENLNRACPNGRNF